MNTQIIEFEKGLIEYFNASPLPAAVKKTIAENIYLKLVNATNDICAKERDLAKEDA